MAEHNATGAKRKTWKKERRTLWAVRWPVGAGAAKICFGSIVRQERGVCDSHHPRGNTAHTPRRHHRGVSLVSWCASRLSSRVHKRLQGVCSSCSRCMRDGSLLEPPCRRHFNADSLHKYYQYGTTTLITLPLRHRLAVRESARQSIERHPPSSLLQDPSVLTRIDRSCPAPLVPAKATAPFAPFTVRTNGLT